VTTWIILRAAGIGAYLMLFSSVAFGLVATSAPFGKRIAKQSAILIHQFMSTVGLVLLGVHIGGLLLDRYIHFGPTQVLVPGTSSYRPVAVAIGILGMYSMILVAVSSWFRRHYSAKIWRALHMAAVPAFVLSLLHGVFTGADSARPWMYLIYVTTATIVIFLLVLRGLTVGLRPVRRAQSSPSGPPERVSVPVAPPASSLDVPVVETIVDPVVERASVAAPVGLADRDDELPASAASVS
jgi:methionine sulfoxide reductase heme-binding subunit